MTRKSMMLLVIANVLCYCVLSFYQTGAAQNHGRHRFDQRAHLGRQAQQNQDDPARHADKPALDPGHADKADILAERGIGEGVEDLRPFEPSEFVEALF